MNRSVLLLAAAALAACSSPVESPAPAPSPEPAAASAPKVPEGAEAGLMAPGFRFPSLAGGAAMTLEDALAAQKGRPLVLVLGDVGCSVSTREMEELSGDGAEGPGSGDAAFVAIVKGKAGEVAGVVPPGTRYPVLVDEEGGVLDRYKVMATPSVVVLDGRGRIAYIGEGGYLPPAQIRELAGCAARGEAIDASKIRPEGG